jgi:hypothetical protein
LIIPLGYAGKQEASSQVQFVFNIVLAGIQGISRQMIFSPENSPYP